MPDYSLYPAVDKATFQFPPEVRKAFSESPEFLDALSVLLSGPEPLPPMVEVALRNIIQTQAVQPGSPLFNLIQDQVLTALTTTAPGAVQDFARMTDPWETTNAVLNSLSPAAIIDGLSVDAAGTGRPVEVTFFCDLAKHSVSDSFVAPYLLVSVDGSDFSATSHLNLTSASSPNTSTTRPLIGIWDIDTAEGSNYQFKIGVCGSTGTSYLNSTVGYSMKLKVRNH